MLSVSVAAALAAAAAAVRKHVRTNSQHILGFHLMDAPISSLQSVGNRKMYNPPHIIKTKPTLPHTGMVPDKRYLLPTIPICCAEGKITLHFPHELLLHIKTYRCEIPNKVFINHASAFLQKLCKSLLACDI